MPYTYEGLSNFGKWFCVVRWHSELWPDSLLKFRRPYLFCNQRQLATWLSTEYDLGTDESFLNVIRYIELWKHTDRVPEAKAKSLRFDFALALALTEFLVINGVRIDCELIWVFNDVMTGEIDPFHYKFEDQCEYHDIPPYDDKEALKLRWSM
jgi:hypothetical protein